jgi:hypothetical protein
METFILVALGFVVGWKLSEIFHVISFKKILEDLDVKEADLRKLHSKLADEAEDEKPAGKIIIEIKVESLHGQLFAYELERDTFVAQGRDGDELLSRIMDKYPANVRVVCDRSNGGELITDAVERLAERNQ